MIVYQFPSSLLPPAASTRYDERMDADNTTAVENNITAPQTVSVDNQSATVQSADDQIARIVFAEGRAEIGPANARGGKRSGWGMLRAAKFVPPGAQ